MVRDPSITPDVDVFPIMKEPLSSILIGVPDSINGVPSSGTPAFGIKSLGIILTGKNPGPEKVRILVESPG